MDIYQAIYTSRPFGYDEGTLIGILMDARRLNERDGITGALICRGDIYIQLLEGPEEKVMSAIERIGRDDRHVEMRLHVTKSVPGRMFGDWAMLHDPAATWIWTLEEVDSGAAERASADEVEAFFVQLRDRQKTAAGTA